MASFTLHPQLQADTTFVSALPLCDILLMNNAYFPWVILVPRVADASQITDLSDTDAQQLMKEVRHASRALEAIFKPTRMNVAALGNMVQQLHVHVIARFTNDAVWPKPVWGTVSKPYTDETNEQMITALQHALQHTAHPQE